MPHLQGDASKASGISGGRLLGHTRRRPYYIAAPRYDSKSAGIKTLYILCHALNMLGEDAYIWLTTPGFAPPPPPGLHCPVLQREEAQAHFDQGRTPILVTSETMDFSPNGGVHVQYLLNYLGLLGGPSRLSPERDLVFAYAGKLADSVPGCDGVLFIPTSDADFWRPPLEDAPPRQGTCAYLGKRTTVHGYGLPPGVQADIILTRETAREDILLALQRSRALHIFENTALATEALLCKCPVVCHFNAQFHELIATRELGADGIVFDPAAPGALEQAESTVGQLRRRYLQSIDEVPTAIANFIRVTQATPVRRPLLAPLFPPQLAGEILTRRLAERVLKWLAATSELGVLGMLRTLPRPRSR